MHETEEPHQQSIERRSNALVLTVEEAARTLGIGRTLMYALIRTGAVESVRIGRLRRVPADALGAYIDCLRAAGGHTEAAA